MTAELEETLEKIRKLQAQTEARLANQVPAVEATRQKLRRTQKRLRELEPASSLAGSCPQCASPPM
jgi:prefoldin subunit 5